MSKYIQGPYRVKNREKYAGNPNNVMSRSSWEYKFFYYLDHNPNIIKWNSEETVIPYKSPLDGKYHRYFVDATVQVRDAQGTINTYLVEVKPYAERFPPKKPQRLTEAYKKKVGTYLVNQAKWEAATEFANKNGIKFIIITEKDLFGKAK